MIKLNLFNNFKLPLIALPLFMLSGVIHAGWVGVGPHAVQPDWINGLMQTDPKSRLERMRYLSREVHLDPLEVVFTVRFRKVSDIIGLRDVWRNENNPLGVAGRDASVKFHIDRNPEVLNLFLEALKILEVLEEDFDHQQYSETILRTVRERALEEQVRRRQLRPEQHPGWTELDRLRSVRFFGSEKQERE